MNESLWLATAYPQSAYPTVQDDLTCEVLIIGGGLSGITNAYFLAKQGKDVVLLEKNSLLHGATGNSTGKLTAQHDLVYADLIAQFDVESAKRYFQVNEQAVQFARSIAKADQLQTAHSALYSQTPEGTERLLAEKKAYEEIGIPFSLAGSAADLPFETAHTLLIEDEAQIHPVRFGQHLAQLAAEEGARLYEHAQVAALDTDRHFVKLASSKTVSYRQLVICSHYPIEALEGMQILKLDVERSYIAAAKTDTPFDHQYIAVDQPKRSIRTATIDDQSYLLLCAESHPAGAEKETQVHYDNITDDLKTTLEHPEIMYKWSAQDPSTPDLVPYAGAISTSSPDVYISTGYRKWGLTNSLASAQIISDAITGKKNPASELYSPGRTEFGSLFSRALLLTGRTVKEFTGGHIARTDSPICTHMGCRTRWNKGDQTWDCPCHGSRFRADGSVLEGPATQPLDLG
ncbi:Gamma-glutamylputrescine oxidoreductase [Sporosarcina sp. P37]|uniref:FAD-dependent oxidoreductase n=1 Tax=unclassified Sporosarcina TaxID=2647733 RepID=UPI000A17B714|nr:MULTISPECIES: FAD-dependent oxidoreductase [unclassified Sporosarcina]ARK24566.1 Gamma-glutamylputrescine oxidoreductase [Sporosarcina sp. P37]PID19723.1 Gamma-glutamylputrescine oxidoreductase [Sporosarcina sp. P35]